MMKALLLYTVLGLMAFAFTGCIASVEVGELRKEQETVELLGAKAVRVEIDVGVGKLTVSGGSDELMNADFEYNVEKWEPIIDYDVRDREGVLKVVQPSAGARRVTKRAKCEWNLKLNDDVPAVLDVKMGAGEGKLHLGNLNLTWATINLGAGEVAIDLSGSRSLERLEVGMGAGSATLDLSGNWTNDLKAEIGGGVGECTVIVPRETGARVKADKGIGKLNVTGLTRDGDYYVNNAYGKTDATIEVSVEAGVGAINLKVDGSV
jgi:hypothetical protein